MTRAQPGTLPIDIHDLHPCLLDPAIGSVSFLNEVMSRFPDAISFAPGAPNLALLADFDIPRYLARYLDWLAARNGISSARALESVLEYGPSAGIINPLIARAVGADYQIAANPSDIVITVGAQEAMLLVLRALCRPDRDIVAVANPSYVGILGVARVLGIEVAGIPEREGGLDFDVLARTCRAARERGRQVRVLYVAPDFANPSGMTLSAEARAALLGVADDQDFYILEDSAYGFTAAAADRLPPLKAMDAHSRVVYVATFAKIATPGVRVGFLIADQRVHIAGRTAGPLAEQIALIKSMVTVNTSPVCQGIVGGLLLEHNGSLNSLAASKAELYRHNLRFLIGELDAQLAPLAASGAVSWTVPKGGFFVRMRLPIRADTSLLHHSAAEFGVLWTPMSSFYLNDAGDCEIRLSCSYLSDAEIEQGVSRLSRFLRSVAL